MNNTQFAIQFAQYEVEMYTAIMPSISDLKMKEIASGRLEGAKQRLKKLNSASK